MKALQNLPLSSFHFVMLWNYLVLFPLHGTIYLISRSLLPTCSSSFLMKQRYRISLERDTHGSFLSNSFLLLSFRTVMIKRIHLSLRYKNCFYRNIPRYAFLWGVIKKQCRNYLEYSNWLSQERWLIFFSMI